MADRLRFQAIRTARVSQICDVAIDVNNPASPQEISDLLRANKFVEFVVNGQEYEDEVWEFHPIDDEEDRSTLGEVT